MAVPAGRGLARWRTLAEILVSTWFLVAAALFAATTLCAIVNFGWRQPMFDQWREYEIFLGLPFPQNVLQMMNGHRPVLPNLVRVAEIEWFHGNQLLQLTIGAVSAFLSAGALSWAAFRERSIEPAARWAGVMVATMGVLWLGNARRLLHGSEALNGYLPTVLAIGAAFAVHRAARSGSRCALAVACAACVLATFSFGLGLASFCGIVLAAALLAVSWQRIAVVAVVLLGALMLYVFVLPGDEAVRDTLRVEPLTTARLLLQFMGSPLKAAWLDIAGSTLDPTNALPMPQQALQASARWLTQDVGAGVDATCLFAGLVGVGLFAASILGIMRRKHAMTRLETVAVATAGYALASGLITVVARLSYLAELPGQVYADRYLVWPALFWSAVALLLLARPSPSRWNTLRIAGMAVLVALPVALLVTQGRMAIWGAIVAREAQRNAAAVRSDVYDSEHFNGEATGDDAHLREIDLLRTRRLAMFAEAGWERLGTRWTGTLQRSQNVTAEARWLPPITDPRRQQPDMHLEGWVTQGIGKARRRGQLALIGEDGMIAGFAEFSFISPVSKSLLLSWPSKRGFDGFVRNPVPQAYTLAVVDFLHNEAIALATLPPPNIPLNAHSVAR